MRIALVITELDPGGAENCLVNLAVYASRQAGVLVKVFVLGPRPEQTKMTGRLDDAGVPWTFYGATSKLSICSTAIWLRRELRKFAPNVIQSMLFHANVLASIAGPRGVPFFGGARVADPSRFRMLIGKWAAKKMTKLICVSEDVADHCHKHEGIERSKLTVITNGIETPTTAELGEIPRPQLLTDFLDASPYLLFVGRLAEQKGILPLAKRIDQLLQDLPNHHFVLLGDGPLKDEIRTAIGTSSAQSRVHLASWTPDPFPWMLHSDCILLPAAYEGMPNVVLEAMSLAKPVTSFSIHGVRELLGDSATANSQMAEPGNWNDFLEKAVRMVQNSALSNQCGIANRERVHASFRLQDKMQMYFDTWLLATGK